MKNVRYSFLLRIDFLDPFIHLTFIIILYSLIFILQFVIVHKTLNIDMHFCN